MVAVVAAVVVTVEMSISGPNGSGMLLSGDSADTAVEDELGALGEPGTTGAEGLRASPLKTKDCVRDLCLGVLGRLGLDGSGGIDVVAGGCSVAVELGGRRGGRYCGTELR